MHERPANSFPDASDQWFTLPEGLLAARAAHQYLTDAQLPITAAVSDDLHLMVSELVTNAVLHGRPAVAMKLIITPRMIRIDVSDVGAPLVWILSAPPPTSQSTGRGLAIVNSIATRWGISPTGSAPGKSVWIELDLAPVA